LARKPFTGTSAYVIIEITITTRRKLVPQRG
jgi:hypothetical protein